MTPSSTQAALTHLQALYPKANTTPAIQQAFVTRLLKIDLTLEQAKAVLDEQRMTSRRRSPSFPEILKALHDTAAQSRKAQAPVSASPPDDRGRPTWFERELVSHIDHGTNPDLVTRLKRKIGATFPDYIADVRARMKAPAPQAPR